MMGLRYPKSVAAAKELDCTALTLADALAKECKNDKSVAEAYDEMVEEGVTTLSYRWCCELRVVGAKFTPAVRRSINRKLDNELTATAFKYAGSPEVLERIIEEAPEEQSISTRYIQDQVRKMGGVPARGQSSPRQTPKMVRELEIQQMADSIVTDLGTLHAAIDQTVDIDQTLIDYVVDRMLTAAKEARSIADGIRKSSTDKRSHLAVVA
jgi:hypothetical protein